MVVENSAQIVRSLNGLLTTELRAINQYFLDSKLAAHWGLDHLAKEFRDASFEEMRDAESLMDRVLLLGSFDDYGPQIAESWKMPEIGVWVLQIRKGVHWQPVPSEAGKLMKTELKARYAGA